MNCLPSIRAGSRHGLALAEIAAVVEGQVASPNQAEIRVDNVRGLSDAIRGCLSYVESEKVAAQALASPAAAFLVPPGVSLGRPSIEVRNPRLAFARALRLFHPEPSFVPGVHPTAAVSPSARIHPEAFVGPLVLIEDEAEVRAGVVIEAGCRIGRGSLLGDQTRLRPGVLVRDGVRIGDRVLLHSRGVYGSAGERVGNSAWQLEIGDDVEAGARVGVGGDYARPTIVGPGTKVDNLVVVGAGAQIGANCILVGHACLEEGVVLGDYCVVAGQAVVTKEVALGPQTTVGSRSVVCGATAPGLTVSGDPARSHKEELRRELFTQRLPAFLDRLEKLEEACGRLSGKPAAE